MFKASQITIIIIIIIIFVYLDNDVRSLNARYLVESRLRISASITVFFTVIAAALFLVRGVLNVLNPRYLLVSYPTKYLYTILRRSTCHHHYDCKLSDTRQFSLVLCALFIMEALSP